MSSKLSILLVMLRATELTLVIKSSYICVFVQIIHLFSPSLVLVFICSKADHVAIFRQEKIKILKKSCNAPLHNQSLNIQMQIQLSKQFTQNACNR